MSPDMRDEPVKEAADDMEQDADRMEGKNEELEEEIDEAKEASELTAEQADPDNAAKDSGDSGGGPDETPDNLAPDDVVREDDER